MKKIIIAILLLSLFPALVSCSTVNAEGKEHTFLATVTSTEERIEVEPDEGQNEVGTYVIVTTNGTKYYDKDGNNVQNLNLAEGTRIKVTYNGQVAKSFPPQVSAQKIQLI